MKARAHPLRLALLVHSFHGRSAAGLRSWNLGHALMAEGVSLFVFCVKGPAPSEKPPAPSIQLFCAPENASHSLAERCDAWARMLHAWTGFGWLAKQTLAWVVFHKRRSPRVVHLSEAFDQKHGVAPVDFILAVWPAFEPLMAAAGIARRTGIPLAVEFQDPWSQFYIPQIRSRALNILRKWVAPARFLVNVCPAWCREDERDFGKPVVCIPTGYWPAPPGPRPPFDPSAPLRLTYTGHLWYFDVHPLVRGIAEARARGARVQFHYFGADHALVRRAFQREGLEDGVTVHEPVSPEAAYAAQAQSDVLLLFTMPSKPSTFGYKFAEVVSHGLPVLIIGPDDPPVREAAARCAPVRACTDARAVADALVALHRARPICAEPCPATAAWTWPALARQLLERIRTEISNGSARQPA